MGGFLLAQEWYAEFQGWITVIRGRIQKYELALSMIYVVFSSLFKLIILGYPMLI